MADRSYLAGLIPPPTAGATVNSNLNLFDLPPEGFRSYLNELAAQGVNTDELMRQYRRANSPFSGFFDWAINSERDIANEGRTTAGAGLFSKEAGTTGMDALASTRIEPANFIAGLLSGGAQAVDAPAAAAQGLLPASDMPMEALGTAGMAMTGGAAMSAPRGSLRSGAIRTAEDAFSDIQQRYPDVKLDIYGSPSRGFTIGRIEVPEGSRGQGIGTQVMRDVLNRADEIGAQVNLTPSDAFGGSVNRLRSFYRDLGFVENKGRNKDYTTRETMYRSPQEFVASANRDATTGAIVLPAARNEAERMARQILEMRAAGRAGDVTDAMMAQADPQYMFNNTPLPMDEASRMARAVEMGLLDDQYHATTGDFQAFMPSETGLSGRGVYTGDYPTDIADYATKGGSSQGLNVIPLSAPAGSRYARNIDWQRTLDADTEFPYNATAEETIAGFKRAADTMSQQGYAGVHNQAGERVTFNPSDLRSRFARFDPEFSHLANLNAANASPLAGILAMPNEEERNRQLGLLFGGYR